MSPSLINGGEMFKEQMKMYMIYKQLALFRIK